MLLFFVSGVWLSKVCYTEDELRAVCYTEDELRAMHDVNKVLDVIKYSGYASAELISELYAIAGNCHFIIVLCKVCSCFITVVENVDVYNEQVFSMYSLDAVLCLTKNNLSVLTAFVSFQKLALIFWS